MKTIHYRIFKGLIAGLLVGLNPAWAEVDQMVIQAGVLLDRGQAKAAFDLLAPQEMPRAGDPDFDTVLGIAAIETGQFTRAIFALERVLAVQPENARARAELGRALFSVGDMRASRKVLMQAKREAIPQGAANTIDQFLQAIDRTEEAARSSVKLYIEAQGGYDSNINSGAGNPNVAVPAFGGAIFTLAPSAVETSSTFTSLGAGLFARHVVDSRWSVMAHLSGMTRGNFKHSAFNTSQFDLNAGASYRYEQHEFSGAIQLGTYSLNKASAREQAGVVGEWTYRPDGFQQWGTYFQWGHLTYPGQSARDTERSVLGANVAYAFRDGLLVFAGGYVGREKERASAFHNIGHRLLGGRAGLQQSVQDSLATFASVGLEKRVYGGADPLFLVARRDMQTSLNVGFNWVPANHWRVTPQLSLVSVRSNTATSGFSKSLFSVAVRRDF